MNNASTIESTDDTALTWTVLVASVVTLLLLVAWAVTNKSQLLPQPVLALMKAPASVQSSVLSPVETAEEADTIAHSAATSEAVPDVVANDDGIESFDSSMGGSNISTIYDSASSEAAASALSMHEQVIAEAILDGAHISQATSPAATGIAFEPALPLVAESVASNADNDVIIIEPPTFAVENPAQIDNSVVVDADTADTKLPSTTSSAAAANPSVVDSPSDQTSAVEKTPARIGAMAEANNAGAESKLTAFERLRSEELGTIPSLMDTVQFDAKSINLAEDSIVALDRLFELLFLYEETAVEITVSSNDFQFDDNNKRVSRDRANAIVQYLADRGLDRTRFRLTGLGRQELPFEAQSVTVATTAVGK